MPEDDHYIPNSRNAHVDTSAFEARVRQQLASPSSRVEEVLEAVYSRIFSMVSRAPREPHESDLICRYLSPTKFLQFVHSRRVNFPMATQFHDQWECAVPEDYEGAVLKVLSELDMSSEAWRRLVKREAACWNVSCWTLLSEHFDDHLLWDAYAGGAQGVGVTVRYGVLKESFLRSVKQLPHNPLFHSGHVNYESLSLLPFNKHQIFRNEREVRFALRTECSGPQTISIDEVFDSFGIRISPAATAEHRDMIRAVWLKFGGADRIQWPR